MALRVPALFLFETLYYFNWEKIAHVFAFSDEGQYFQADFARNYLEWNIHIMGEFLQVSTMHTCGHDQRVAGYLLAALLMLLPLDTLVQFYRLLVTGLCMLGAHFVSWRFVSDEINAAVSQSQADAALAPDHAPQTTQELLLTLFKSTTDLHLSPSIEHDTFQ